MQQDPIRSILVDTSVDVCEESSDTMLNPVDEVACEIRYAHI